MSNLKLFSILDMETGIFIRPYSRNQSTVIRHLIFIIIILICTVPGAVLGAEDPDELYRNGKFKEAEEAYADLDMDHPKDIRFRYNRGCAAFQNSDFQTATAAFSSVIRRTKDNKIRFKASYNLGNTAFKQGDYKSALNYYKQAIQLVPENEDARYNLELTLREIEKQKEKENKEQEDQSQNNKGDKGKGKDQSINSEQDGGSKEQSEPPPMEDKQQSEEHGHDKDQETVEGQDAHQNQPKDLSGELESARTFPEPLDKETGVPPVSDLDRRKAEALLENLKEDRTKFMRFQVPRDKRNGVGSGKDW